MNLRRAFLFLAFAASLALAGGCSDPTGSGPTATSGTALTPPSAPGAPGRQADLLIPLSMAEASPNHGPRPRRSRLVGLDPAREREGLDALTRIPQGNDALPRAWRLPMGLFPDRRVHLVLHPAERQLGTRIWRGVVEGEPGSAARVAVRPGGLAATVEVAGAVFQIGGVSEGVYRVDEFAPEAPGEECGGAPVPDLGAGREGAAAADDGSTVDMMIVYTTAARGSQTPQQMEARAAQSVSDWNLVLLANSQAARPRMRLVHVAEVAYTQHASSMGADLDALTGTSDGSMDEIHALRTQHGADLVHLLLADATPVPDRPGFVTTGIAWRPGSAAQFNAIYGFGVTALPYAVAPRYTFVHEVGHNFGAHHGNTSTEFGFPSYNRGYWLSGTAGSGTYGTIMTYAGSRRPYFSNPDMTDPGPSDPPLGLPLGGAVGSSYEAAAARGVAENAFRVAAFRAEVLAVPQAPTGLAAVGAAWNRVDLSWQDESSAETGFQVERRSGTGAFAPVADLGAGTEAWSDTGVIGSRQYVYRVRAVNAAGPSGYSGEAAATTPEEPLNLEIGGMLSVPQGWSMISLPVSEVTGASPWEGLVTTAYSWNADAGAYQAVDLRDAEALNAGEGTGRGFWAFATQPTFLAWSGWVNRGAHEDPEVLLRAGWNLVGLPHREDRPLSAFQVAAPGGAPQPLTSSVSATLPRPAPDILLFHLGFLFAGSTYESLVLSQPANLVPTGRGMWVYVHEDGVRLLYGSAP